MAVGENARLNRVGSSNQQQSFFHFNNVNMVEELQQNIIMSSQQQQSSIASNQQPLNHLNRILQGNLSYIHGKSNDHQSQNQIQIINGVQKMRNSGDVFVKFGFDDFKREMKYVEEMLSSRLKLNPMAESFVPSSSSSSSIGKSNHHRLPLPPPPSGHFGYSASSNHPQKKSDNANGKQRRMNIRTSTAQKQQVIRRTVYVSGIDHKVTEDQLARVFLHCGQVVDCRICGDPNSVLRFAFIEFTDEDGATNALNLSGIVLGFYPLKVGPSKTAIAPVNPTFLPQSEEEKEVCARTIYCTNIDKKVTDAGVKIFFESVCGKVQRLKLLGDRHHYTRIAFVEFVMAESATAALNCNGSILGHLPLRISPSKTPVRHRPRP